ncbi:DTW domain-containing protein [Shewanella sp. E94]|nr:tRNA-uridine aminocarboxypropyltransferase [Shewanella sp. MTB7]MEC4735862.1 DTW domain-containing protein [Shewanella sp. E94]
MKVILLTHEREVDRPTNTGILALNLYPQWCSRVIWSRVDSNKEVLTLLASTQAAVLFPKAETALESGEEVNLNLELDSKTQYLDSPPQTIIILDATWQEARKMLRQSPYLKVAKKFALSQQTSSQFNLRRNQIQGGLCTVECIIEMCHLVGMNTEAIELEQIFSEFNQ